MCLRLNLFWISVTDSKTSQNSTVSEKAALVPKSADWAYETYDVDITPAGSGDQDTSNNDASEDDGDIDVGKVTFQL